MKEYFMTLMSVSLLSGVIVMISPNGSAKKYIRFLCALCLLCAMVNPLIPFISNAEGNIEGAFEYEKDDESLNYDEIYNNSLLDGNRINIEKNLKSLMIEEFDMKDDAFEVSVNIEIKNDKYEIDEVTVYLKDSAVFSDPRTIISYVNETLECECNIIYD